MSRAGPMRHEIEIQARSTSQTSSGQPLFSWATFATVWASVEPLLGGRELLAAEERQARTPTRFRIRYIDGVKPKMRILWRDRWFDILTVQEPMGIKHELVIMADELVDVPMTG